MKAPQSLIRPLVRELHPYVYGEQPKIKGLIKLNTNENPYPPSPKVLAAVKAAVDGRLRLYPSPTAPALRERLAKLHGCHADNIIVGNGSDELLALATRALVEPKRKAESGKRKQTVQYFTPSYSLYPVLADIHGAAKNPVPLNPDFSLPSIAQLKNGSRKPPEGGTPNKWDFDAALTFVTTPNAPSGRGYKTAELEQLCRAQKGVVVLDEAYVDFAEENAMRLALKYPHVLVARTFSKAYSLCFQRVGYFVGHRGLIAALHKIRDSYNVNGLGQVAAVATLGDLKYYRANFKKIIATREWLSRELTRLGFRVFPSRTNFILIQPPATARASPPVRRKTTHGQDARATNAREWQRQLRQRKILVRWFDFPEVINYLRITVGTPAEAAALAKAVREILGKE